MVDKIFCGSLVVPTANSTMDIRGMEGLFSDLLFLSMGSDVSICAGTCDGTIASVAMSVAAVTAVTAGHCLLVMLIDDVIIIFIFTR